MTLSWAVVAREQVRTELDEVSPHRAPSIALVGEGDAVFPGPSAVLNHPLGVCSDTNMDFKNKLWGEPGLSPTAIPQVDACV